MNSFEMEQESSFKRAQAEKLLLRYGRNSFAWQILNQGMSLWLSSDKRAVVGYLKCKKIRMVTGSPITSLDNLKNAARQFELDAKKKGEKVCYFGAQSRFKEVFIREQTHRTILLGAQPAWNPRDWDLTVFTKTSVKELIRYATRRNVRVEEISVQVISQGDEYQNCVHEWLDRKKLPKLQFLMNSDIFKNTKGRRFFAAQKNGKLIGFLCLIPIAGRNGWLIEHIFRGKEATRGMNELLIDTVMRKLDQEGSTYVTLGLAPLSKKAGLSYAMNPVWLRATFRWFYNEGAHFYNFSGLDDFKSKFKPHRWEPVYAIINKPRFSPITCYRIASAFCQTSPFLFGLSAAIRTAFN